MFGFPAPQRGNQGRSPVDPTIGCDTLSYCLHLVCVFLHVIVVIVVVVRLFLFLLSFPYVVCTKSIIGFIFRGTLYVQVSRVLRH